MRSLLQKRSFEFLEVSHKEELENLRRSHDETFKKYQKDTKKNIIEDLTKWRSNLLLHVQVVVGYFDLRLVDFNCLGNISAGSLNFNIYHFEGEEWGSFQKEWRQSGDLFIPNTLDAEDNEEGSTFYDQNLEDPPPAEEVPTEPTNQSNDGEE